MALPCKRMKKEENLGEFIEAIKCYPFLYDKESDDWKNKSMKAKTWSDIAANFSEFENGE